MTRIARCVWISAGLLALIGSVIAADGQRVVAVGGAVTEIAFALGKGGSVVASDTTSTYPETAAKMTKIGYMRSLAAEGVLSLRPDLVLATAEAGPANVLGQLRNAGVKVEVLPATHTFENLRDNVRLAATAFNVEADGSKLIGSLDREWRDTRRDVAALPGAPRVLFILAHAANRLLVAGTGTGADAMIRYAGGVNALADVQGYKPLSGEALVQAAPDVILITAEGITALGGPEKVWELPGVSLTPAGQHQRLVAMDAQYLLGFGPRLPRATLELARRLRAG